MWVGTHVHAYVHSSCSNSRGSFLDVSNGGKWSYLLVINHLKSQVAISFSFLFLHNLFSAVVGVMPVYL